MASSEAPISVPLHPLRCWTRRRAGRIRGLVVAAAMLLSVFVAAVGTAEPASAYYRTTYENQIAWAVQKLINYERSLHGLHPVWMSDKLRLSAHRHNLRMAYYDEMSHQLPGEASFGQREINAGYYWNYAGENIAWNSDMSKSGVLLLERLMYNEKPPEDGHRLNILSSHFRHVGVDVYMDKTNGKVWLTTDFGHPR